MNIKDEEKILVVAPHPDDESIGAGGLIALYGAQCDVLLLTDGRYGHVGLKGVNEENLIEVRKREIKEAVETIGISDLFFLNIEDKKLYKNKKKVYKFDITQYNYIFVPNRYETNIDHRIVYSIFKKMIRRQKSKALLYEYEVWTPLRCPTDFVDITNVIDKKKKMISCHKSQLKDCDYIEKGIALSSYRGMYSHFNYAEAFVKSSKMKTGEIKQNLSPQIIMLIRRIVEFSVFGSKD